MAKKAASVYVTQFCVSGDHKLCKGGVRNPSKGVSWKPCCCTSKDCTHEPAPKAPPVDKTKESNPFGITVVVATDSKLGVMTETSVPSGQRRPKGILEDQVLQVCAAFAQGNVVFKNNKCLTPYRIAKIIEFETGFMPSTGAINAVFARWILYQFAVIVKPPIHFDSFTDLAGELSITQLREKYEEYFQGVPD
jgi:hypothetical protein